jgi:hypothetical protein
MRHSDIKLIYKENLSTDCKGIEKHSVADRLESRQLRTPYMARSLPDRLRWATILVRKYTT